MSQTSNTDTQKWNPLNQKIKFTFPWIITIPQTTSDEDDETFTHTFRTSYKFSAIKWYLVLSRDQLSILTSQHSSEDGVPIQVWNGKCFVTYKMFLDNEMEVELYSSPRIAASSHPISDSFSVAEGFLEEFSEAFREKRVAKMEITIEVQLPTKYFYRPFEIPGIGFDRRTCDQYPADMMDEDNFRFEFLKDGDYLIKCSDGSVPAIKMVLNITCGFLNKHFKQTNDSELIVEHKMDVVKPIITYLHSFCFEMPQSYDVDFAKRLLAAIDLFEPDRKSEIRQSIHYSLCQKFVEETFDFCSLLQWISLASRHSLFYLADMTVSVVAGKHYCEWNETFPENARNNNNPIFAEVFGLQNQNLWIFDEIDRIFKDSLDTNVIITT